LIVAQVQTKINDFLATKSGMIEKLLVTFVCAGNQHIEPLRKGLLLRVTWQIR